MACTYARKQKRILPTKVDGKLDGMPINEAATLAWIGSLERLDRLARMQRRGAVGNRQIIARTGYDRISGGVRAEFLAFGVRS